MQGETLPLESTEQSFEPFLEDRLTPKEKKEIDVGCRPHDLLSLAISILTSMIRNLEEHLEEIDDDKPDNPNQSSISWKICKPS